MKEILVQIGEQELEFMKFFKNCCEDRIRCFNDSWLIQSNDINKDMSVEERYSKIIEYKQHREFSEMALEWLNRVMS